MFKRGGLSEGNATLCILDPKNEMQKVQRRGIKRRKFNVLTFCDFLFHTAKVRFGGSLRLIPLFLSFDYTFGGPKMQNSEFPPLNPPLLVHPFERSKEGD